MKPEDTTPPHLDDEALARLIASAGRRPLIPAEDLDAINASARAAWQARARGGAAVARAEAPGEPGWGAPGGAVSDRWVRTDARSHRPLAIAAVLIGLALGLALAVRWAARPDGAQPAATAAILEGATGLLQIEVGATTREIGSGDAIPLGALVRTGGGDEGGGGRRSPGDAAPVRAALRMHGGSSVRLDAGTAVRLASADRIDLISGALYADTGRRLEGNAGGGAVGDAGAGAEASAALEIRTDLGIARDLGTRFMVRRFEAAAGPALDVLVRDGAVALEREPGGEPVIAGAGEQLVAGGDGAVERRHVSPYGPEWAWVMDAAAPVALEGRTFADILEWVSRETGWTVRYEDEAVAEIARRAVLEGGGGAAARALRPDQAPFVLLETARLEGTLEEGVLTVRRSR